MASGSFPFSNGVDNTELMMNSQQESNMVLPTSIGPFQHHHPIAPIQQNPNADIVIAVSPTTLLNDNRFVCHICHKGFPREQNLTLHHRVHNLPFNLTRTQRDEVPKKVYICPEPTCINHNPSYALGDFGGLKKHYLRRHTTDKKHKCKYCYKTYAVESDLKAHLKLCLTKKYKCECGAGFSSHLKYKHHTNSCDAQMLKDATKVAPNFNMMNNLPRSINNKNITSSFNSTTSYLSSSYMGDNSSRSKKDNMGNLITDSTMSNLPTINKGHRSVQSISNNNIHLEFTASHIGPQATTLDLATISSNIFSLSSTQQSPNAFQEKTPIGYYTNLLMNTDNINMNDDNTRFMRDGNHYGSGEGSNLFSDSGFSSGETRGLSVQEEHYVPFGMSNFVENMDLYGSTSRTNNNSKMVQPYTTFSSGGGSIIPQQHKFLYANEHLSIPDSIGFSHIMNPLHNPQFGNDVGSSFINEDDHSIYNQGNYYGYVNESSQSYYGAGREVLNSEAFGETTSVVAPYEVQYWNDTMGSF